MISIFKNPKPLIGMIHLPPLPGYPKHPGMDQVVNKAITDLVTLQKAGFDGALVENDNDQPHQIGVSNEIVEAFTKIMETVKNKGTFPVGMEIIYDMQQTIKVAINLGVPFVRLDVYVDNVKTVWGKIPASANSIIEIIKSYKGKPPLLFTDIQVKHAKTLHNMPLSWSAKEAYKKGSDGLIVTGDWTGVQPNINDLLITKRTVPELPLFIGSGLNINNVKELASLADGAIVGSSIKTGDYVDFEKAKKLVELWRYY